MATAYTLYYNSTIRIWFARIDIGIHRETDCAKDTGLSSAEIQQIIEENFFGLTLHKDQGLQ